MDGTEAIVGDKPPILQQKVTSPSKMCPFGKHYILILMYRRKTTNERDLIERLGNVSRQPEHRHASPLLPLQLPELQFGHICCTTLQLGSLCSCGRCRNRQFPFFSSTSASEPPQSLKYTLRGIRCWHSITNQFCGRSTCRNT